MGALETLKNTFTMLNMHSIWLLYSNKLITPIQLSWMICLRMQIYLFLLQTGFFTMWSLEIDSLLEPASSIHFPMCFISPSRFSVKQFYVSTQDNTCEHIEEFLMDKQSWRADVVINTFGWQVKVAGLIRVRHTDFCWVCVRKSIRHKFCLIKQSYLLWWPQGAHNKV